MMRLPNIEGVFTPKDRVKVELGKVEFNQEVSRAP